jgi:hypothetical protein
VSGLDVTQRFEMAKKKTTGSDTSSGNGAPEVRRRGAPRREGAAGDQSPLTGGMATTTEEVQLAVANDAAGPARQPSYEEIAEAAYQRYLSRGAAHGQDFEDWVEAERELNKRRK